MRFQTEWSSAKRGVRLLLSRFRAFGISYAFPFCLHPIALRNSRTTTLIDSQGRVRHVKNDLVKVMDLLQLKRTTVSQLWIRSNQLKEMLRILDQMYVYLLTHCFQRSENIRLFRKRSDLPVLITFSSLLPRPPKNKKKKKQNKKKS
jgi:hypothetical protein